jgi:hypothetical protein
MITTTLPMITGDDYSTADDDYYSFESGCVGDLPQSQYDALELLYTATGGEQWDMDWYGWTSWSFPSSLAAPCSDHWAWVYCGRNYDALDGCVVTGLDLSIMRLNGTLPTVSLPNLVFLSLGWNNLRGNFSAWDMSGFSSLVTLYMDDNEFSGPLPGTFAMPSSLRIIYADRNFFSGSFPHDLDRTAPNLLLYSAS